MPSWTSLAPRIERATIAASTLKELSEVSQLRYVKVIAGTSLLILETIQNVKHNQDQCLAMIDQIDELLCVIINLSMSTPGSTPPTLLESMAKFSETLQRIGSWMRGQQDMGRIKHFFRQQENTVKLEDCKAGLALALDALTVQNKLYVAGSLAEFRAAEEVKHQQLLSLLASNGDDSGSSVDSEDSTVASQLLSLRDNFSTLSLVLPGAPQIFHGRESEVKEVVASLLKEEARVAILGAGGIGKTSLARTAMHHSDVLAKLSERYFVSCESSQTAEDVMIVVASSLGLEPSGKLSQRIIQTLSAKDACLLVLDNFETPWEPRETRNKVEDFLSLLADLPKLALLVTMRGQERPLKTRWTRPFIQPLKPLSAAATRQTFLDITDFKGGDEHHVTELLALTGNLPLAVTLMAKAAAFDGCENVLLRWRQDSIGVLSEWGDKETNLEVSLRLSLSSPRMVSSPELLGLLSLLPDGVLDADLLHSECPIPAIPDSRTTLLRTSLAYTDGPRLKVLVPVREFVKKRYPPALDIWRSLRLYWDELLMLWRTYSMPSGDLIHRLTANVGNFASLLRFGLDTAETTELKDIAYGIFYLNSFLCTTLGSVTPLMAEIPRLIEQVDDYKLRGYYILSRLDVDGANIPKADVPRLIEEGQRSFALAKDVSSQARLNQAAAIYYDRAGDTTEAFKCCEVALQLAHQAGDNARMSYTTSWRMASFKNNQGHFRDALVLARSAQRYAANIGTFYRETEAIQEEARAWIGLGNFVHGIELCDRAHQLVIAAGLQGSAFEIALFDFEADIRLEKTEYPAARAVNEIIVRSTSLETSVLFHANSLANILSIDIAMGHLPSQESVVAALDKTRHLFTSRGYPRGLPMGDRIFADFLAASGQKDAAKNLYESCVRQTQGIYAPVMRASLRKLGDITLGLCNPHDTVCWATIYFAYAKTTGSILLVAWAFRLLGEIFSVQGDAESARTLLEIALTEFTRMDIHQGKGECLLGLSRLSKAQDDHAAGIRYFEEGQRMLGKSGLAPNSQQVYEAHSDEKNTGRLNSEEYRELNIPSVPTCSPGVGIIVDGQGYQSSRPM